MPESKCYSCGKKITGTPVACANCGESFCEKHRLPEAHSCADILGQRELYDGGNKSTKI